MTRKDFENEPPCPKCLKDIEDHENSIDFDLGQHDTNDCRLCAWGYNFEEEYLNTVDAKDIRDPEGDDGGDEGL